MTDISASPGRQAPANQLRPKEPPPMVIQGDFRKVDNQHLIYYIILLHLNIYEYIIFNEVFMQLINFTRINIRLGFKTEREYYFYIPEAENFTGERNQHRDFQANRDSRK